MYTPFIVMCGMILNHDYHKNIEISSGKVIDDGSKTIAIGMAMPGLKESLGLENEDIDIPNTVEITMDSTDFEMGNIASFVTPKLIEESDLSIFDDLDKIYDKVNLLESSSNQLVDGANTLKNGANTYLEKSKEFGNGLKEVANGVNIANSNYTKLDDGINSLYENSGALIDGAKEINNGTKSVSDGASSLYSGAKEINNGAKQVDDGIALLQKELNNFMGSSTSSSRAGTVSAADLEALNTKAGKDLKAAQTALESVSSATPKPTLTKEEQVIITNLIASNNLTDEQKAALSHAMTDLSSANSAFQSLTPTLETVGTALSSAGTAITADAEALKTASNTQSVLTEKIQTELMPNIEKLKKRYFCSIKWNF